MIRHIARKEFTEMVRSGRFRWAAAVVGVLLVLALLSGAWHYRTVAAEHAFVAGQERARWLDQGPKTPHGAAHYGTHLFKPRMPLSPLETGIEPYVGEVVYLEAHRANDFEYRPAEDATAAQRFGTLTAAVTLHTLLPLLIILLTFGAFAAEREAGTLRQVMSMGVRPRDLALGKALGVARALALLLVPALALGLAALALSAGPDGLAFSAGRALAMALVYLAYFAVVVALALVVSARARSSRAALVGLLAFWLVTTLVAPRLATDLAGAASPTPSIHAFTGGIAREIARGNAPGGLVDQRTEARARALLARHGADSLAGIPVARVGLRMDESEGYADEVYGRHYDGLFEAYERQHAGVQLAGVLAPVLAVQSLSMGLAGTDLAQHQHFYAAAERYRRAFVTRLHADVIANPTADGSSYVAEAALWAEVPPFAYTAPGLGWVLARQWIAVLVLAGWLALLLALLPRAVRTMRVD